MMMYFLIGIDDNLSKCTDVLELRLKETIVHGCKWINFEMDRMKQRLYIEIITNFNSML